MKLRAPATALLAGVVTWALTFPAAAATNGVTTRVADASTRGTVLARPLTGAAVYYEYNRGVRIDRYQPGKGFARIGAPSDNLQFSASPDGKKVAWITTRGELKVGWGSKVTTVAKGLPAGIPCLTPTWSPDSRQVAYVGGSRTDLSPVGVVNLDGTGRRAAGRTVGVCHLAWSGDGRYLAGYAGTADAVYKLDVKTGKSVKAKGVTFPTHVQSLSPDGRNVIVNMVRKGEPTGDGGWPSLFTPTIVDTVTGKKVPIPVKGRLVGAFYLADGRLVVRVAGAAYNSLVVLDGTGRRLQTIAEPAKARQLGLLQIIP
ncbi:TolB family protein [Sphaerisporangium album]|uniref:TolB family protein n=1 Tax=Sphaerisporangium album TaxID=509200 RepID=UPI0015F04F7C|nr:PD40 domain-containing protein [Sphaerisporangium album]